MTTPAVEKHNLSVPCHITLRFEGDSYLRIIWDLHPRLQLWCNRWPHICRPGLSWAWFTQARKTEEMPKRREALTLWSPSFKLIYVPWGSLSSPAKFFSVWCPVLLQMSLSFALNSDLECFPFCQFHLSSGLNSWDDLRNFMEVYWRNIYSGWDFKDVPQFTELREIQRSGQNVQKILLFSKTRVMFMLDRKVILQFNLIEQHCQSTDSIVM